MSQAATRYYGLDWLRAGAALAVVALHAGIAYTVAPFPGLAWPVHDARPSAIVDALTWWIDSWIMPVFFLMSGFLAAQLFARLGPEEFLRHRARRLLSPLVFACVVILPLDLYVWLLGWVVEERIPLKKLRSLKLGEAGNGLWGIGHLWFLEYLLVFSAAAWVLRWGWQRTAARRGRRWLPAVTRSVSEGMESPVSEAPRLGCGLQNDATQAGSKRWLVLPVLAACSAVALWWDPQLVIGFRHAWHPLPANLLYYAPCFAAGWWLQTSGTTGSTSRRWLIAGLLASPLLFAGVLPLIHDDSATGLEGMRRVALVAGFTACGWLTATSVFRLSVQPWGPAPRVVRYVADASLWVYLFHHPVVGLAQVALHGSRLSAESKFVLVCVAATGLSLLTYEAFVRRTWIGALLNGRRDAPTAPPEVALARDVERRAA